MTQFLIRLGHHRIAILSGKKGVSTSEDRVAGCQQAMSDAHLDAPLVCYGAFTQESGYEMARQMLVTTPRPTALFAANNFIAIGTLKALKEANLRVPEDISLVGFDDLPPALITYPFFTVVVQPAYEIGKAAAELLIARLKGQETGLFQDIVFPSEVIIRESSGAAIG
jgi:DNA-binding LacI/PurR family transcriptional regulator